MSTVPIRNAARLLMLLLLLGLHINVSAADTLWLDVRTGEEFAEAHLAAAVNIPYDQIADRIEHYAPDKNRALVVYCRSGRRADIAKQTLEQLGYTNVVNAQDLDGAEALYQQQARASD